MKVIIGVDPHKATHTAVAIGAAEDELARVRVRATRRQVAQLLSWGSRSRSGPGRSSPPAVSAIYSLSSS